MSGLTGEYVIKAAQEAAHQLRPWIEEEGRERNSQIWQAEEIWIAPPCKAQDDNTGAEVAAGNWNGPVMEKAARIFEELGYRLLWSDEAAECSECYGMIDTSPHSYSHRPEYVYLEDTGPVCIGCLFEDEDLLAHYIEEMTDDPTRAVPYHIDEEVLDRLGFSHEPKDDTYHGGYETGWHPGQDDEPAKEYARIKARRPDIEVLFRIVEPSQFYTRWQIWTRDPSAQESE